MSRTSFRAYFLFSVLICALVGLYGCGGGDVSNLGNNSSNGTKLNIVWPQSQASAASSSLVIPPDVTELWLEIRSTDMTTIVQSLPLNQTSVTINIPDGANREFVVMGYSAGVTVPRYFGSTTANVSGNTTVQVTMSNSYFLNSLVKGEYFYTTYMEHPANLSPNIRTVPNGSIVIDGNTGDWAGIDPFIVDSTGTTAQVGADISNVYLAQDATYLYARIDLANGAPQAGISYAFQLQATSLYMINTSGASAITSIYNTDTGGAPIATDTAASGAACVEMRIPLAALGPLTQGNIVAWTLTPALPVSINYDITDSKAGRFVQITNTVRRQSEIGVISFDGLGHGALIEGIYGNNDDQVDMVVPPSPLFGYTVNTDGTVSLSGMNGEMCGMQKGGRMIICASTSRKTDANFSIPDQLIQEVMVLYRKGGTHTAADFDGLGSFAVSFHKINTTVFSLFNQLNFSASGTYTYNGTQNSPGGMTPISGTNSFIVVNPDGRMMDTVNQIRTNPTKTFSREFRRARDSSKNFASAVNTTNRISNEQAITFALNKPTIAMSNGFLKGEYFFTHYRQTGMAGSRGSGFARMNCDGAGSCSYSMTESDSVNGTETFTGALTYTVAADGAVTLNNGSNTLHGALNEAGDILIWADVNNTSDQDIGIGVKSR